MPEYKDKELSKLVSRSQTEGTMWYHMILQGFFHGPGSLPWEELKAHTHDWNALAAGIPEEDIQTFVATKMEHLKLHDERLKRTDTAYDEMLAGKWSIEGFVDHVEAPYKQAAEIPEEIPATCVTGEGAQLKTARRGGRQRSRPPPMTCWLAVTVEAAYPSSTRDMAGLRPARMKVPMGI